MEDSNVPRCMQEYPKGSNLPTERAPNDASLEPDGNPLQLSDLVEDETTTAAPMQKKGGDKLVSMASIETQPPMNYNYGGSLYQTPNFSYESEKNMIGYGPGYNDCYGLENSWPYNGGSQMDSLQMVNSQLSLGSQGSHFSGLTNKREGSSGSASYTSEYQIKDQPLLKHSSLIDRVSNKVVAMDPVILVDKVERSLIVQWHENGIKREQRISYKKYGNAKAQQRAESLIAKLMSGSTFDQLYPEKGPPILTIFENVGEYRVSLTRDRIKREWKVEWINGNGGKMRARWSCKKVGNEEAKKRAEAFANSLLQGTFNPRLLHKATGTRLSRNDMKYNILVEDEEQPKHSAFGGNEPMKAPGAAQAIYGPRATKAVRGAAGQRRKGGRGTGKKKAEAMGFYGASGCRMPGDFMKMSPDASYSGAFQMYMADRPYSSSVLGSSYDTVTSAGDALMPNNWHNWNSAGQNLDYSGEWEYSEPPMDYAQYNQMYDMGQPNYAEQMEWMRNGCMMDYMRVGTDGPLTTAREVTDETGAEVSNPGEQFYQYFRQNPSLCYNDSNFLQDQLRLSGSYFDIDFLQKEQSSSQSRCSYIKPLWNEMEPLDAKARQVMKGMTKVNVAVPAGHNYDGGDMTTTTNLISKTESTDECLNDMDLSRAPTIRPWSSYDNMKVPDISVDEINYAPNYPVAGMQSMYMEDKADYLQKEHTSGTKTDEEGVENFNSQMSEAGMGTFYAANKMEMNNDLKKPNLMHSAMAQQTV